MAESTPVDPNSPDEAVNHHEQPLAFLDTFDALRARPQRWLYQSLTRMERRAAKRLPASRGGSGESHERGGITEPPPVLDLVTTDTNRRELVGLLKRRSVLHSVWEPGDRPGAAAPMIAAGAGGPVEGATGRGTAGEDGAGTGVTTGELYELLERLSLGSDLPEDPPRADAGNQPPPPPPFRRLNSLLQLRECEVSNIHKGAVGGDDDSKTPLLSHDRRTQFYVVAELRKVRFRRTDAAARASRSANQRSQEQGLPGAEGENGAEQGGPGKGSPDSADSWITGLALRGGSALATAQAAAARLSAALAVRLANVGNFSLLDSLFLTPFAFVVTFLLSVGPPVIHLLITQASGWVTTAAAVLVFLGLVIKPPMLHIPWLRYRWLDRHRYILDDTPEGQGAGHEPTNHRTRGIHVLNLLNQAGHAPGWIEPGDRRKPPNIHRLAVNAFLDDLHETYGSSRLRHQWGPRRKRGQRPVLIVDQARADRVTTYLVRLIEDERLRRAFPDPLLVVQVRTADEAPLLTGDPEEDRYLVLPEGREGRVGKPGETPAAAGGPELTPRAIAVWRRRRYTSGVLGARRLLLQKVGPDAAQWRDNPGRPPYDWVLAPKPLAVVWSSAGVLVTTFSLLAGLVVGPEIVKLENDCVLKGMFPPAGIVRVNDECVGVTDGETIFHDRLELVTGFIREENEAIKDEEDYVTVVHVGELSRPITESEPLALAGIQGELHGIAAAQALHNRSAGRPKVKVLLANTGHSWSAAETTASEITRLVEDKRLGKDRPIGAVGFGHSVEANNQIIRALGDVHLPMVGTTATFDDIAFHHNEYPSYLFFPIAPSNTRLAQVSAFWARAGVSKNIETEDGRVQEHSLASANRAVAIANAEPGETYGSHLAEAFMAEFTELGGTPWGDPQGIPGTEPGVLSYRVSGPKEMGIRSRLKEVCADPPNLIYFAGRSTEFEDLQTALDEDGRCKDAPIAILAGDDVAKYVTDYPDKIRRARHPVYYTPLAASGDWNQNILQEERGFYDEMTAVEEEHYGGEEDDPDARPSVAHAVIGYDAMRAVSRALEFDFQAETPDEEAASSTEPASDPGSTPGPPDDAKAYERDRAQFLSNLQADRWTGVSGHIQFGVTTKGNWNDDRMVQLVLAGPRDAQGHHQHVMAVCGRISEDRSGEDPGEDSDCPEEKGSDGETKTAESG